MNIAEKLQLIVENQQKVHDAGYAAGHVEGQSSAVTYVPQTPTPEQQTQARENIGAIGIDDLDEFEKNSNKTQDIETDKESETAYPSAKAVSDYTDKQCEAVLDYMQTTFAQNIMALVQNTYGAHIIYSDPTGFEASNNDAGETWHLTGLDLSPYKRIKCYVCAGGDGDANYSPEHIVEVHLDDRAKGSFGYFSADHAGHCPNNRNRHHIVTFTVNAEKTAIQFQHSISIYGTAASNSSGGRRCYLIEGYLV